MASIDRREFVVGTVAAAALAGVAKMATAAPGQMKLSQSVRIVEGSNARPSEVKYEDFLSVVKSTGFDAVCMRGTQGGLFTTIDRNYEMARLTKQAGLTISMVSPDYNVAANNDRAADCLRNITPYLTVAEIFGCDMVRVGVKKEEDIPFAQRAADEARERKIRLVHHAEYRTMFATFEETMSTLKAINRKNFGFVHDECQWMVNTKDYRADQMGDKMKAIRPWLWNVYVKNQPREGSDPNRPEIPMADKGGVDWDRHFDALNAIGYTGYITVHERTAPGSTWQQAIPLNYGFLKPYVAHTRVPAKS